MARGQYPCAKILAAKSDSAYTEGRALDVALKDTPSGQIVYQKLQQALAVNPTTYSDLERLFKNKDATVRDFVGFIIQDRARLIALIDSLMNQISPTDRVAQLLRHVRSMLTNDGGPRNERLHQIIQWYGDRPWKTREQDSHLVAFYMTNYTYISEVMTALELRGLVYSNVHISSLIPPDKLPAFEEYLEKRGKSQLLRYELDAVTYDKRRNEMTWYEVKHYNQKFERKHRLSEIGQRAQKLQKVMNAIRNCPDLKGIFPSKIVIRYVIRGAGIGVEAQKIALQKYGVVVDDRGVENFNSQFGVASRSAAGF